MSEDIQALRLSQSKSYLKIIRILYFINDTDVSINSEFIKLVIKPNHIFNDLSLTSRPRVIKTSSKSDIAVVWIDIWNSQSSKNAKMLINRCFNIGRHIATICGTNMNSNILQCKKWRHTTFTYRIQELKCVKYNGLHKSKHHHYFIWCYKVNFKINPLSSLQTVDLVFLYFIFHFHFHFILFFYF